MDSDGLPLIGPGLDYTKVVLISFDPFSRYILCVTLTSDHMTLHVHPEEGHVTSGRGRQQG